MAIVNQNGVAHQSGLNSNLLLGPKKAVLERLASIDLIDLCNEAKVEHCRATRDLRSCGRFVHHMLISCGHASLCAECSQRCEWCPICRTPMLQNGNRIRLRLYYECMQAGLISKTYDDKFPEKEDSENQIAADVQRLYSIFDVALENNLVSLICHYITDVCMDESAVSSDPVMSFLLDEVVVKDWCKRAFGNIIEYLRQILTDALVLEEMKTKMSSLLKLLSQVTGISSVLEVLESSIKGTHSAQNDLHSLQDKVLKTKQHLEIMMWCIRHQFVENIKSCYPNHQSWHSLFRERKSAAVKRSWPELITSTSADSAQPNGGTLFIEDALSNLEIEQEYVQEIEVASLVSDRSTPSLFELKINGIAGCYPFENLRSATDLLFLYGSSDMVVAKKAIFLYYLFDRHWARPDSDWREIIEDFAASFSINRHSLLESLIFYLLDDHTDQALQEACSLLPEIAGPATHPKIAQVLLERQNSDAALMVLRWSGLDGLCAYANSEHGRTQLVSLREAVTAVRARVECGLLTEAFMYQRTHHIKAKEEKSKRGSCQVLSSELKGEQETWVDRMEALVTEICCLCIRRNLVDRMIELPWNSDEEKYIHKCLFDYTTGDPSTTFGSLLVVFYLQRFRYTEAYQVDRKLQSLEQDCISKGSTKEVVSRINSTSQWRAGLVDKCIELLPKSQQQQVKSGNFDIQFSPGMEVESISRTGLAVAHSPNPTSSLPPLLADSSRINSTILLNTPALEAPHRLGEYASNSYSEPNNYSPSILHRKFLTPGVRGVPTSYKDKLASKTVGTRDSFILNDFSTSGIHLVTPESNKVPREMNRSSSRVIHSNHLRHNNGEEVLPGRQPNLFGNQVAYLSKIPIDQMSTPHYDQLSKDTVQDLSPFFSGKESPLDRHWKGVTMIDSMEYSWSIGKGDSAVEGMNMNGGLRWRSDETSEDEKEPSPQRNIGGTSTLIPTVRPRRRVLRR
ncbi:E3 ubiquitin-protein ligase hos1 [Thalictrum thalictroides]|uniref:E3 ubiquitin-protein ligase hos1 n=1 Tax=Thalictrum thalictroides TaxID=46969 RepID=A0A7J6UVJ2_THATH|nr:E3 ubiquitin-protein ligase hos1 [Thalictrum thalictroides]